MSGPSRRLAPPLFALCAVAASAIPSVADAQVVERFTLRGEGSVGFLLSSFQRDVLRDSLVGFNGSLRLSFFVVDPVALQVSAGQWYFPTEGGGAGGLVTVSGGVRVEPRLSERLRAQIDVNVGAGFTGPLTRLGFDAGIGVEYAVTPFLSLGPVVRYQYLLRTEQDIGESPQMLSAGLSLSLRVPRTPPAEPAPVPLPPADTDRDGVLDTADACPTTPAGEHPDPNRAGCPEGDRDQDRVLDSADQCPDQPAGDHPDANRAGCPVGDHDGDGVLDDSDVCIDVPAGDHPDPHRAGCPDGDDDHDGVTNSADQCPTEPQGLHADPARPGCPQADRDGDSVPDTLDHCPDQPGAPSTDPNRNGCPSDVSIQGGFVRITQSIQFRTDSDVLRPVSIRILRRVADALRATPEIHRVAIEGHTDDTGNEAHNQDLSDRRARAVLTWLTDHGVEASRLESHGYGATHPLVQGTDNTARATNRRVDFHILDPAMPEGEARTAPAASAPGPQHHRVHHAPGQQPPQHHHHHAH